MGHSVEIENDIHFPSFSARVAEVRSLDFPRFLGAGILHTKMWLVDDEHFYLGSGNMDWRSLTQVKVAGVQMRKEKH